MRLFNVASTQIGSGVQHQEMFKASTLPKEIQVQVACPLNVDDQNAQELKPRDLISHACKAL